MTMELPLREDKQGRELYQLLVEMVEHFAGCEQGCWCSLRCLLFGNRHVACQSKRRELATSPETFEALQASG